MRPSEGGWECFEFVIGESHSVFLLLDVPKLDSEVSRCSSKSVLNNRMPSGIEDLLAVSLKFSISLFNVFSDTIGFHDPKLASRIIGSRGKKLVIEGRELEIIDNSVMTLAQWDSHIKLLVGIGLEASKSAWAIPANSSEFTSIGSAVRIILAAWHDTIKSLFGLDTKEISKLQRLLLCDHVV